MGPAYAPAGAADPAWSAGASGAADPAAEAGASGAADPAAEAGGCVARPGDAAKPGDGATMPGGPRPSSAAPTVSAPGPIANSAAPTVSGPGPLDAAPACGAAIVAGGEAELAICAALADCGATVSATDGA